MRKFAVILFLSGVIISCKNKESVEQPAAVEQETISSSFSSFGAEFETEDSIDKEKMKQLYANLEVGDSLDVAFETSVNSVCKKKGCWMRVDLAEGEEILVKFRDYAFFVPKDIEDEKVVVKGKAYITEVPVEELKHYAEDAGKSKAEIAAITKPERSMSFLADGVLIEQK
jgi:hypothetical protein